LSLELAKDGFFVGKQIADKLVSVLLLHCQRGFLAGAKHARSNAGSEGGDILLIGGGELNEAGEVVHAGVEGSDIGESELG
jgi:hypothetical protein